MKKILLGLAASVFSFGVCMPKDAGKVVSIDSIEIMQKSKEGKLLSDEIKKKINEYQELVDKAQKELAELEKEIKDKKDVWSKDALEEKNRSLETKKKELGGKLAQQEDALRMEIQSKQIQLRNKQLAVTNKMSEDNAWGVVIDKNTPGVLFVSKAIDKTSEVLKKIDADFDTASKSISDIKVAKAGSSAKAKLSKKSA